MKRRPKKGRKIVMRAGEHIFTLTAQAARSIGRQLVQGTDLADGTGAA